MKFSVSYKIPGEQFVDTYGIVDNGAYPLETYLGKRFQLWRNKNIIDETDTMFDARESLYTHIMDNLQAHITSFEGQIKRFKNVVLELEGGINKFLSTERK